SRFVRPYADGRRSLTFDALRSANVRPAGRNRSERHGYCTTSDRDVVEIQVRRTSLDRSPDPNRIGPRGSARRLQRPPARRPARSGLVVERYFPTSAGRSPADRSLTTLGTSVLVRLGGRGSMVNMSPPSALCVITRDP